MVAGVAFALTPMYTTQESGSAASIGVHVIPDQIIKLRLLAAMSFKLR